MQLFSKKGVGNQDRCWKSEQGIPNQDRVFKISTVNSRFKKDLKLQIHLHRAFFSDNRFLDSLHKSFFNQTTLNLRKENGHS